MYSDLVLSDDIFSGLRVDNRKQILRLVSIMGQKSQLVPKLLISPAHAVIVKSQARKEIQHHD